MQLQQKNDKQTSNGWQKTTQKTKDWTTRTLLETGDMNSSAPEGYSVPFPNAAFVV